MPDALFELVTVPTGARSLRSREHGETFHPGIGPMEEARALHVAQHRLAERMRPGAPFVIWDVGLGAGANALAAIGALRHAPAPVHLLSFDQTLEPLRFALAHAAELQYPLPFRAEIETLLARGSVEMGSVAWSIVQGDFRERVRDFSAPRAVLFDPYSPAANPGMWTREVFQAIRERADAECTLSSYSRSTVTRVNLLRAGWCVGRGSATGEKTETSVAATREALLREPLRREWLERVRRSTAPGLRIGGDTPQAIARELESHPQMR
ncbi:MAG TPA: MnmC family methyltransferase [Chthoniobacteraceae bacterium]|jgi:tRNA U34 5-methylaminomethyl-2-thiouridine-forming methyltransferase MnmC|nr:MnmC family methyltransferase [Chthoniobacteraceae bacterium]